MSDVIRKLQQRIDKRSNWIAQNESKYAKTWKPAWKEIVEAHTLDKRLMGELVGLERYRKSGFKRFFEIGTENVMLKLELKMRQMGIWKEG